MKTIEEKAEEYIKPFRVSLLGCETDLMKEAYLAGATEALAGQWRSVEDELSPVDKDVLVSMGCGEFGVAWLTSLSNGTCKWYSNDDTLSLDNIKYWMPIPKSPKDETE
ncbi:MAG: hypothetical protein K2H46_02580 [Muribaculaceae bacterium]|nr:hypothetical protein [Muribaculaceae bacterium]